MSIRVLQVLGGSQFGGAVWVVQSYVEALQEHGCSVSVCTSVPAVADVFRRSGCEIVSTPEIRRDVNPARDTAALARLTAVCRRGRFDVVHTHTSKGGFIGRAAARLARVPIILHTAHGFAFHESSSRLGTAAYTGLERLAGHWCDRIITVSEFHRNWAVRERIASPGKIVAVPNGIGPARVEHGRDRTDMRRALSVEDGDLLLVSIGRLAPQKGLSTLIRAAPILATAGIDTRVLIVGEGPLRLELEAEARATGVEDSVTLLGFRTDIGDILNAADIVVAPSLWEGLSISVLEAMSVGKAIVATNIGSNLELLEDGVTGLLVPPDDPDRLAAAILILARDRGLALRYGAAAIERFEQRFTERAMKDSLWAVYRGLLDQKLGKTRLNAT